MGSSIFDSVLYRDAFSTPGMRSIFSDETLIANFVRAEVALAVAQGNVGVIPKAAAEAIAARAPSLAVDRDLLRAETENVGYPILGLVRQLSTSLDEAGKYLHWGATTQDIMDTATVLQIKDGLESIEEDLAGTIAELARLAETYRDTPMPGRTHLQQALPITFGHKAAIWLSSLLRCRNRLAEVKPRVLVAQLGGAVGTLASFGDRGLDVRRAYAQALGLLEPDISWHVARDGFVEVVQVLAVLCGALGKIGYDVMILMATEIGEVFEPFASHRGASSTMPQKRNPISSEILLANAKIARDASALMLDAMVQDLERATGPWHVEWNALPQTFMLASGSLAQAKFMLAGLVVDTARMRANLAGSRGLIVAEAVMMGLAPILGRQASHDLVYDACRAAIGQDIALADALWRIAAVREAIDRHRLDSLCEPGNYLGTAPLMVDRVLEHVPRPLARRSPTQTEGNVDAA